METSKETHKIDALTPLNEDKNLPVKVITLKELEFLHIIHAMFCYSGNRTKVAKVLGFSIRTLRNKLDEYKIERNIVFPMTGCSTLNKAQFRHVFLIHNRLHQDKFTFKEVEVADQMEQVLISDYGFPAYLMDQIKENYFNSSR